ncbi:MAG: Sec-independent protein translocase protein TatB [Caulobacteraceae bacterium]|nr:Sec-independent protein translocase protein TatB [Caulobacteraceae bacterium]
MGGLGPGIGGFEILVIGIVALLVVGPKDLPLLMRKIGKVMARARAMANDFRSSFDEMARQSELDELRKEVQALRTGQGIVPLGAEAEAAFREIRDDLNRPLDEPVMLAAPDEWPDTPPVMTPLDPVAAPTPKAPVKAATKSRKSPAKAGDAPAVSRKTASGTARSARSRKGEL